MPALSVVIITYNEEINIGRCLESVKEIADDVVVVDSGSTDKTEEICKKYNVQFFTVPWKGYSEQKNYANSLAKYNWIFSIDADEAISEELKKSILEIKHKPEAGNYRICRITNYCGKWIHHSGWYPDIKVRFFSRNLNFWEGLIHERLNVSDDNVIPLLKGDCYHYSYYSISGHKEQSRKFSKLAAENLFSKGKKAGILKLLFGPGWKFFTMYFIRLGWLDGTKGFTIARISAHAVFQKYNKLRQLNEKRPL
jgi:glycosyltransferase involved in cell wall biosynthesis